MPINIYIFKINKQNAFTFDKSLYIWRKKIIMSTSILKKGYIKIKLSGAERKMLLAIKGDSDISSFIGFLIRSHKESMCDSSEWTPMDRTGSSLVNNIKLTMDRMFEKVSDQKVITNGVTSITESVGELGILDEEFQIQIRLQSDKSAYIHPYASELGRNNAIYMDLN